MNVKKICLALLTVALISAMLVLATSAASPEIHVSDATVTAGSKVSIEINLENNPGLIVMRAFVEYNDKYFTLTKVTDGGILGDSAHSLNYKNSPQTLYWSNPLLSKDITKNGEIATLTFDVDEDTPAGTYDVEVYFEKNDVINSDLESVGDEFDFSSGKITVRALGDNDKDEDKEDEKSYKDPTVYMKFYEPKIMAGDEFSIELNIKNNPGIVALRTLLDYDDRYFTVTGIKDHKLIGECMSNYDSADESPLVIYCSAPLSKTNIDEDGRIVTVSFKTKTTTPAGKYSFKLSSDNTDIIDTSLEALGDEFNIEDGTLTVTEYAEDGDKDDDGEDDTKNDEDEDEEYVISSQNGRTVVGIYTPCISYGEGTLVSFDKTLLEKALAAARKKYSGNNVDVTVVAKELPEDKDEVIANFPKGYVNGLTANDTLTLRIGETWITYNGEAITSLKTAKDSVQVIFRNRKLSQEVSEQFKNGYVFYDIEMSQKLDGGKAMIKLPYPNKAGIDQKHIVVYGIRENKLENVGSDVTYRNGYISFSDSMIRPYAVTVEELGFEDIENHWAKSSINFVAARGIFNGKGETEFAPDEVLSRGMLMTVLGRLDGIDISDYNCMFADVDKNQYYAPYIEWARKNNIVGGVGDNKFEPDREITRQEMAVIITRYLEYKGETLSDNEKVYADSANIDSWAKTSVNKVSNAGIITGSGDDFLPKHEATRAQTAAILERIIKFIG